MIGLNPDVASRSSSQQVARVFPMSFAQQQLWFLDQLDPGSSVYNIARTMKLSGSLDRGALENSLAEIVRRHEVLRAGYQLLNDQPVQIVHDPEPLLLPVLDLSALPGEQQQVALARVCKEEGRKGFDLQSGRLMRAHLFRMRSDEHVLFLGTHHIASDGWSLRLLIQELAELYGDFSCGNVPPDTDLPAQYRDFTLWQREYLQGQTLEELLSFWKTQLQGAPPFLDLPGKAAESGTATFRGAVQCRVFPKPLADELKRLSRTADVTLFMVLVAAFQALLARYSGQEDIVIGVPVAYRRRPEFEKLIGFFANTLVLRTDVSGDPSFTQLLKRVRETALRAHTHQDLPFQTLVEALRPERRLSRNPLFQVMLAFQPPPISSVAFPHLTLTPNPSPIDTGTAKFDLSLSVNEREGELSCELEYNAERFEEIMVSRLLGHFQHFLEQAVDDPEQRLSQIRLLSESESRELLLEYNQSAMPIDHSTVHSGVEEQVRRTPDATAVVCGAEKITYSELNARANQLAHYLMGRGAGPETLVGIAVGRGTDMIVALLAVLKAGAAYLPIDLSYPADRVAYILEDSNVRWLITQDQTAAEFPTGGIDLIQMDALRAVIAQESTQNPIAGSSSDTLAYVIYTSGSTGKPKGVQVTHRSVVNLISSMRHELGFRASEILLAVTTLSFDIAGLEIYLPLLTGSTVAVATREEVVDPARLLTAMQRYKPTIMQATPTAWRVLLVSGWTGDPKLKILCGGEALPGELACELLPRCQSLWNLYGPTETTIWSSVHRVSANDTSTVVPIGRPIANTSMYVLDGQLRPLPVGVTGELYIGGIGVSRGYLGRPDLTTQKFIPDPFGSTGDARLYRTGDFAKYDSEGTLHFCGRKDTQVKLRGFRIELGEIETVLARGPAIQNAVVVLRQDVPGEPQLVAYVVPNNGCHADPMILRQELKRCLPEYMVPSAFVVLEALPLTANGKIDRQVLPAPSPPNLSELTPVKPRDEIEETLVRIWEKVLNVSPVSIQDNFFELGGHSILAVKLMSEIRTVVGRQLPLASLFQDATIEHLTNIIRQAPEGLNYPLVMEIRTGRQQSAQPSGASPPLFCVAAPGVNAVGYIALARHMDPDQPLYKLQAPRPGMPAALGPRPYTEAEWEALASEYIRGMRTVQAEGPYFLGGMCGGARIAYDMARQLRAEGQKVNLLAIFDTWAFENTQVRLLWKIDYYSRRWRELRKSSTTGEVRLSSLIARRASKLIGSLSEGNQQRDSSESSLWAAAFWPGPNFVPATYSGRITLFKLPKQPFYRIRDSQLGWGSRALEGVDVHVVGSDSQGRHMDIFREPLVGELARALTDCLRTARGLATNTLHAL